MTFVTSGTALYAGIRLWRQGMQVARYFTVAWSSFLLAALLATLEKFGYFPSTVWANFFLPVGVILIVSLLSLALAARINVERQGRMQAQQQLILQSEKNQAELEHKIAERTAELARANAELQLLATTDSLTGIDNRRHFLERAKHEIEVSVRYRRPVALVMLDIDFFKAVNDTYGHDVGDKVLCHLVAICRRTFRESDVIGRLGGEEFGILLMEAQASAAQAAAERLRREVEASSIEHEGAHIRITVSQGICAVGSSQQRLSIEQMLKVADDAMYQAKDSGRNRVNVIEC
jgi:diguanylate cyclase